MTPSKKQLASLKAANAARAERGTSPYRIGKPVAAIFPEAVYAFSLIAELFGIGEFTLREAESEDGMKTLWFGKRKFVKGSELIAAMERQTDRRLVRRE